MFNSGRIVICMILLMRILTSASFAGERMARLYTNGGWQKNRNGKCLKQQFEFISDGAEFKLIYDIEINQNTPPGKCSSRKWIFKKGFIPLGMTAPSGANWYKQGFLKIRVDGISLHDIPATFRIIRASGPDTMLEGTWITPEGPVYVRFGLRGYDDKLLMQIVPAPETTAEKIEVELLAYPEGFTEPKNLYMLTAKRNIPGPKTISLDMQKEPWMIYYDKEKSAGPCGMVYVPDELQNIVVNIKPVQINTIMIAKPGTRHLTIGLWDFSRVRGDYSDKTGYITEYPDNALHIAKDLRAIAKTDWMNTPLPKMWIPDKQRKKYLRRNLPTPFDQITTNVVTPHISWAKPLAGGPVRTLVIAPLWMQRETVELAQRLDMDFDTVCLSGNMLHFYYWLYLYNAYDAYGYERKTEFTVLNKLETELAKNHDCLIMSWSASFNPAVIPNEIKQTIVDKVRNGSGLLLCGDAKKLLTEFGKQANPVSWRPERVPMSTLPVIGRMLKQEKPPLQAYTFGRGRIVILNYPIDNSRLGRAVLTPSLTFADPDVLDYYDYFHSLLADTVLWLSHRKLPVSIHFGSAPDCIIIDSSQLIYNAEIKLLVDDIPHAYRHLSDSKIDIPKGQSSFSLADIGMPNGPRYLNVRIIKDGKTLGWNTRYVTLNTDTPVIEAVNIQNMRIQPGDTLKGNIQLSGKDNYDLLQLEIKDSAGRIVVRRKIKPTGTTTLFSLKFDNPLTVLHYITVRLISNKKVIDQRTEQFTVAADRRINDYHWLVWMTSKNNATAHYVLDQLSKAGVDWINNYGIQGSTQADSEKYLFNASLHGMRSIPYITRIAPSSCDNRVRRPCLTDPVFIRDWTAGLREIAKGAAPYEPFAYSLGDENHLADKNIDVCTSPTCLTAFHKYLQQKYGEIKSLNESWQTGFKNFKEPVPALYTEIKDHPELWPRWIDHRMFMDTVFANAHALGRKAIREIDPGARVGWEGLLPLNINVWYGYDFYQLCKACDLVQVYAQNKLQLEYLRSFRNPDSVFGAWYNEIGNSSKANAKELAWELLFHGCNSSWYWMADGTGPALLFPDLRSSPELAWLSESIGEIQTGIGKLLLNARRANDGIAIHYSQASMLCGALLGRDADKPQWGFARLIEDLGLQYNFVASQEIERGSLKNYKVLILPASAALSPAETKKITAFVKQGGLVIADTAPGILDNHGKFLHKGQLDELFGINCTTLPRIGGGLSRLTEGGMNAQLNLPLCDTGIKLHGAKAWGTVSTGNTNTPCVLVYQSGKGTSVLLNMPIEYYDLFQLTDGNKPVNYGESLRVSGKGNAVRQLMAKLLELGNIRPDCRITDNKMNVAGCETVRFFNGRIQYVGIIKDNIIKGAVPQTVTIKLPYKSHLYDLRKKQYLGYTDSVNTLLTPLDPKVFALLPYEVKSVAVKMITDHVDAGTVAVVRATINIDAAELAGQHCIHVDVYSPAGQLMRLYGKNILTAESVITVKIPTALNDPAGQWKIKITDAATGVSGQAEFTVRTFSESL